MNTNLLRRRILVLAVLFLALSISPYAGIGQEEDRPSTWAQPVIVDGVPNLFKVSESLYRSAQPTPEGWKALKAMGIKTVINLRNEHDDQQDAVGAGLIYITIPSRAEYVRKDDVLRFLRAVSDPSGAPFLVHCHHGADRTGLMTAVYRVVIEGWDKGEAIKEMKKGGFGFHSIYTNIPRFIRNIDVSEYRFSATGKKKVDSGRITDIKISGALE